ncbi:hypothetical protein KDN32_02485 [Nocardioides sp. J2M5]|uniref:colicin immunity domain-containing protein n=1 Tax=Nocardioides palaemonis TaxID=2829810 RepID=UPI001BAC06CF|nr:colicin immunity domain-containing protein [Nocardioides palaemonis]MBS2936607.1 hypothetical protein [Nocardioides palaemonis]
MADDRQSTTDSLKRLVEYHQSDDASLAQFEERFLALHARVPADLPDDVAAVLDELFWAVESYVSDPALRDPGDTGGDELRAAIRRAHSALTHHEG